MTRKLLLILGTLLGAASVWIWVQDIMIPYQEARSLREDIPRGNLSDLYPRWLGARELLLRRRDPYSGEITREIQTGYYGRPIDPNRPNDPKDQQAFAYPIYVVFLLGPTIGFPFPIVQRVFLALLVVLTSASVLFWFKALRWRVAPTAKILWIVLVLGSFPAIQGFKLQQLTLLVAALLAAGMACVVRRRFVVAGILLALASIKPQLVLLTAIWVMIWIVGNWRERQRLFWTAAISLGGMVLTGECLLPGWIHEFRVATFAYYRYTGGGRSLLDIAVTPIAGRILAVILVFALMFMLWRLRHESEASAGFRWSLGAVFATTLLVIPMSSPYNQVLLVPCVMLIVQNVRSIWEANRVSRFLLLLAASSVAWPWIASFALDVALFLLPANLVQRALPVPLGTTLMIPLALATLVFVGRKAICSSSIAA